MKNSRIESLFDYPFQKLAVLLNGVEPKAGLKPIMMQLGEPQLPEPDFVAETIHENRATWRKYPPIRGSDEYNTAAADWLTRRYHLPAGMIDPARNLIALPGTKEGLFQMAQYAVPGPADWPEDGPPLVAMSDPAYHVYKGAATMAGAETLMLPARAENNFLPDYTTLTPQTLRRIALFYLCSPANPQGTFADIGYLSGLIELARRYDFIVAFDECYSEIYRGDPPTGALEACVALGGSMDNMVVFHSLSKRSNAAGLRCGFVAGETEIIDGFNMLRATGGAQVPLPLLAAGAALWRDETHVIPTRAHYAKLFDMAERILGNRPGFYKPPAGFFLWLDVGDGEKATLELWRDHAVRTIPGAYYTRTDPRTGENPGKSYIRVALVHDLDTAEEGLRRIAGYLGE
jgi:N-succinyldiaminopimelate aminotransferase